MKKLHPKCRLDTPRRGSVKLRCVLCVVRELLQREKVYFSNIKMTKKRDVDEQYLAPLSEILIIVKV